MPHIPFRTGTLCKCQLFHIILLILYLSFSTPPKCSAIDCACYNYYSAQVLLLCSVNGVQGWSLVRSNPGEWLVTSYFLLHYLLYQLL